MLGAMFALSSVIGPTLGGFVADQLSWRGISYINIPLGISVIALFVMFFPHISSQPGATPGLSGNGGVGVNGCAVALGPILGRPSVLVGCPVRSWDC
ncbi:MAG: hypothetical protein BZY75_00860 [SAR202 cluster bacterium Io17-Chloro-G7]|nr:MAG: hypothetical protein BZY75_00860 [SAR202 cluster bacterium Io17-Chloro-G7]